ncbi:hypothetical protein CEXT_179821 [Caerostris extrusa]|uniref:Uncharacterized protein n=1 Tax=Caerostris extrusa TaxID=172846 RepID=A0AAV4NNG1_CAEEX|nr:hypothetical protein CEXT_179821 [Caerostris extrusa]
MCQFEGREALGSQVLECEKITQTEGRTPREGKQPEGGKIKRSFQKNRSGKKRPDVVPERNKEKKEKGTNKGTEKLTLNEDPKSEAECLSGYTTS